MASAAADGELVGLSPAIGVGTPGETAVGSAPDGATVLPASDDQPSTSESSRRGP